MVRRRTHEEFVAEVKALVGDEYEVLGLYINSLINIKMLHKDCNEEYTVRPKNFLMGRRCLKCFGNHKKTTQQFKEEVYNIVENEYEVLGEYVNNRTKIEMVHKKCNVPYLVYPFSFLRGDRCPKCFGNHKKTTQQFKEEVYNIVENEYEVLGEYVNAGTKIEIVHKKCNETNLISPNSFLRGNRCPKCNESKGERRIREWLELRQISFNAQEPVKYNAQKYPLKFDFYVQGVAIEYDGKQHFKPVERFGGERGFIETQRRDAIKNKYCADNGIPLIRIPYWEYDNIDAILTEKLLPLLADSNAKVTQSQAS